MRFLPPRTALDCDRGVVLIGDSARAQLPEHCAHAIVTDPPAGIGFMGRAWDGDKGGRDQWVAWLAATLAPWVRALRPGGHAAVWALPRTSHWTALALELAGLEIRDQVVHVFGTGFPKSLTSASAEIPEWSGTALKPAHEVWWIARKPLDGTTAETWARWGTGVLNVEASRVETRWPASLALSHLGGCGEACEEGCPVARLDAQAGPTRGQHSANKGRSTGVVYNAPSSRPPPRDAVGSASRFFYCPKPARGERDLGLEHLEPLGGGDVTDREEGSAGLGNPRAGTGRGGGARNTHPTVKSVRLMRWLARLVAPPGGVVLDPFAGSGSTLIGAYLAGLDFVGCELAEDPRYEQILLGRVRAALDGRFDSIADK